MAATKRAGAKTVAADLRETGISDAALNQLREWDSDWVEKYQQMATNPWTNGILSVKEIELICIAVNVACTNLNAAGVRRHIRAALEAGATRDEILELIKMGTGLAIHSCSLGAPILLEEAEAAGVPSARRGQVAPTPFCDQMRTIGQWNTAWDPFFEQDPVWTDRFFALGAAIYQRGVLTPKFIELLSIAYDASFTHMYAPGTRRHIRAALKLGATREEIMEVLKLCVSAGVEASHMAVPILADELNQFEARK
ncbi:MAG TPA: carboxymuconolactone decarboxylase family protein [Vicinamibacterales bacterium]|nr:carboxymuconolactone decarboxylase family protein [Vicinamibacterales bacterium]